MSCRIVGQCALVCLCVVLAGAWLVPGRALAQETGEITGQVLSEETGEPLAGALVRVRETERGAVSDEEGRFTIQRVPSGSRIMEISFMGYRSESRSVEVVPGDRAEVAVSLIPRPLEVGGIQVSVLRPDLHPQVQLAEREVRRANPKDAGELLRELGGVDAVRRGPLGLDPVVRGLRETEVGTYLDGTRLFPAGPARMDSPLTHLDPSAVREMEVVKGPYALTWGAGNLAAIRLETADVPPRYAPGVSGSVTTGRDSNLDASELYGSLSARVGEVAVWSHGAWRRGEDYRSGDDERIPGDFRSVEGRGKLALDVSESSRVSLGAGYQDQGPLDYPGRLLNADFFEASNVSLHWDTQRESGALRTFEAVAYRNQVDHGMGNWEKPTSKPMEGRMPPFALDVKVRSAIEVRGGRAAADLEHGPWSFRVGGDVYEAHRDAVRTIRRQDNDMLIFEDLMWPDATITDAGLFARAGRTTESGIRLAGTLRLDLVTASADTASEFFRTEVAPDLDADETNLSAAATLGLPVSDGWDLSIGIGSAVRTADATERYSDRIPASKAQTSAEFVGNPGLSPERSTQLDLWLEGRLPEVAAQVNVFARRIHDYISLRPTELPKRLPLSPDTVFQYTNGRATFGGGEASVTVGLTSDLTAELGGSVLWGREDSLDEPALGVAPTNARGGLRWEHPGGAFFAQGALVAVGPQDRVATARGETPTPGYATVDLRGGWVPLTGTRLRFGVDNVLDRGYVTHLNAKNPFTGTRISEPGRVVFLEASYQF